MRIAVSQISAFSCRFASADLLVYPAFLVVFYPCMSYCWVYDRYTSMFRFAQRKSIQSNVHLFIQACLHLAGARVIQHDDCTDMRSVVCHDGLPLRRLNAVRVRTSEVPRSAAAATTDCN